MYVLKYKDYYVLDFGYPSFSHTKNINKAAFWFSKRDIKNNAREYGFDIPDKYKIIKCGMVELEESPE